MCCRGRGVGGNGLAVSDFPPRETDEDQTTNKDLLLFGVMSDLRLLFPSRDDDGRQAIDIDDLGPGKRGEQ